LKKIAKTVSKTKMTIFLHQIHSESQKHVHLTTRTANYKYLGKNVKKCQSEKEHQNLATYGATYSTKKFTWVFKKVAQMVKFCPIWSLTHGKIS